MLNINPCQQGRYFGIRFVVLKRSIKIKLIQRSNNTFRHSVCQHGGQNNRNHRNKIIGCIMPSTSAGTEALSVEIRRNEPSLSIFAQ